jgi:hypothetical protein
VSGEAIRGLAKLQADERERCANFATRAVAAGLGKRLVEAAELQGQLLAKALGALPDILRKAGVSESQMQTIAAELEQLPAA